MAEEQQPAATVEEEKRRSRSARAARKRAEENAADGAGEDGDEEPEKPKLTLDVKVEKTGSCKRHIAVSIAKDDIDRYFEDKFSDMMPEAKVPGFRPGRAPRKLVESRFRNEVREQVKASLLMDSLAQINDEHSMAAISEPEFDLDAVEVPDDGPMVFEFDLEVRPEFDLPNWKGLNVNRPSYPITEQDVQKRVREILVDSSTVAPYDGPAERGDYLTCNFTFRLDGEVIAQVKDEEVCLRAVLSLRDGNVDKFGELLDGAKAGETRSGKAKISAHAPDESRRGKEVDVDIEVLDVKRMEHPELTPDLLKDLGDFESEEAFRDGIRKELQRRLEYHQKQSARQQITQALIKDANWDLPQEMLKRQAQRELERAVLELRRAGFTETDVKAHANRLRQDSLATTAKALKEHFILERIAEEEEIEATDGEYDTEVLYIALQSGQSPRKVRARLEKQGLMDVLRNQIVERKVIDMVLLEATYKDVPFAPETRPDTEAIDHSAGGGDRGDEIPQAKKADAGELPGADSSRES